MKPARRLARAGSAPLSADQIQKELGLLAGSQPASICLILEAARIPNQRVIPFAAEQVARMLGVCPWVALHAGLPPALTLRAQLERIAASAPSGRRLEFGSQAPEFFVFGDGGRRLPTPLINLAGVLFLIRLSVGADVGTGLNTTQIRSIESLIRDHLNRPSLRAHWSLFSTLDDAVSLRELAARLEATSKDSSAWPAFEQKTVEILRSWVADFLQFREAQLRRRLESRAQDLLAHISWFEPQPGDDEPEFGPAPLAPLPGGDKLSDEYRGALAAQSTRTRNTSFQKIHAEVLLDEQVGAVVTRGFAKLADRAIKVGDKPKWIVTLLTAATGRLYGFLPRIGLGEGPSPSSGEPYFDLTHGILHLPQVAPPNIHRPDPDDKRFVFAESGLGLPLPTDLVTVVHQFWKENPVARIGDWLMGRDPERLILDCLRQIDSVPLHTREPAALRKWMPCQLFEHWPDLVALMVICGDTFGLSDAALYYYAPPSKDLVRHYIDAIWPMFRRTPTSSDQPKTIDLPVAMGRAGAAALVRTEVVKSGFDFLSGQLAASKSKARDTVQGLVGYHRAYTDYFSRRFCLSTTHRPHESLYGLTRHQLGLSSQLAILGDKQVDAEHFTRLTSTTTGQTEMSVDYLVHLRFLAEHPMASAAAKQYLLGVCAGKHPLLVYLDVVEERFEARPGCLDDWTNGAPRQWSGLRPNFHRAFLLNALREVEGSRGDPTEAGLTAVILAQGGHLDVAGHPFSDDAVTTPGVLMSTLQPALETVEHSLKLRRSKGLSDEFSSDQQKAIRAEILTPPPLRDWSGDLADHEQARRRLQRDISERLKSMLRSVGKEAEQWLERELPLLSPRLSQVLRAAIRSDHESAPLELRKVVIDDLEILEVQERISEISGNGGLTALQVATHNLFSKWIRQARDRLALQCKRIDRYRLQVGRGMSPFLINNLVAVDQANYLRAHLEGQLRKSDLKLAKPIEVACALTLHDPQLSKEEILAIATGRLPVHHLPKQPGVLVAERPDRGSILTLTGLAAVVTGQYTAEALVADSAQIQDLDDLGRAMLDWCPAALRPSVAGSFLDALHQTIRIAARVEEAPLLRTASAVTKSPEASLQESIAFHSKSIPLLNVSKYPVRKSLDVDPDRAIDRKEPLVAVAPSNDLKRRYRALLRAIRDPKGYLHGVVQKSGGGISSTRASSAEIRQALQMFSGKGPAEPQSASDLGVVDGLMSYAGYLNDRSLRAEQPLEQSSILTYLSDIGPALIETFGTVDLRALAEEDFDDCYRLIGDMIGQRDNAPRARMQLRAFHDHLVRDFEIAEATIQFMQGPESATPADAARRQLLSDASYVAAIDWIVRQLERNDIDGLRYGRWRRALLNAGVVTVMLRRGGLRINECLWLRYRDVFRLGGRWYLSVEPSRLRGLKTRAARRLIRLDFESDPQGQKLLETWLETERLRGAGGEGGKNLLFPHLEHPRTSLGDDAIRRLIQLAFRSSCGIEMTPHELRHLWVTDQWTKAITNGLGGTSPATLTRRLDAIRVATGHARLTTTRDHYIHHLGLLKLQSVGGSSHPGTLRPMLEAVSTTGIATLDKAWQRSQTNQQVCWNGESERLRLAVARQHGPRRPVRDTRSVSELPAVPVESKQPCFTPMVLDTWLRPVSNAAEFEVLGFGVGMDRTTIQSALEGIHALAASPAHFRFLESPTRRDRISLARRPRPHHPLLDEAMLNASSWNWLGSAAKLVGECVRPALLREGALRKPDDFLRDDLDQIVALLPPDCEMSATESGRLRIAYASKRRSLVPQVAWNLAVGAVSAKIIGLA